MNEFYNQTYTKEEVEVILEKIKDCIKKDQFIISKNEKRQENIQFINEYRLDASKQKEILVSIDKMDFCHSLQNTKIGFEWETLYVFCPQRTLFDVFGEEELVDIYTKFNVIETGKDKRVVTISFHKRNKPIEYAFR